MFVLAAGFNGTAAAIVGGALGVIIVLVLIGAFVVGAWRKEREPAPELEPQAPERELWATPPSTPGRHRDPHGDPQEHPRAHEYEYPEETEPRPEDYSRTTDRPQAQRYPQAAQQHPQAQQGGRAAGKRRHLIGHRG